MPASRYCRLTPSFAPVPLFSTYRVHKNRNSYLRSIRMRTRPPPHGCRRRDPNAQARQSAGGWRRRASGIRPRSLRAKLRSQTSVALSGPGSNQRDCMPCCARATSSVETVWNLGENKVVTCQKGNVMARFAPIGLLLCLAGCLDQSRGAVLNACHLQYYLESPTVQAVNMSDCMHERNFQLMTECSPVSAEHGWDWQEFAYEEPKCYRPIGSTAWTATLLSPM
jgi:hypothetical protein